MNRIARYGAEAAAALVSRRRRRAMLILARARRLPPAARIAHLRRAVAEDPQYERAHAFLGFALLALDQTDEAIACFERALALAPDEPSHHQGLARAQALAGQTGAARQTLERWVDRMPQNPQAWSALAETLTPAEARARISQLTAHAGYDPTLCRTLMTASPDAAEAERWARRLRLIALRDPDGIPAGLARLPDLERRPRLRQLAWWQANERRRALRSPRTAATHERVPAKDLIEACASWETAYPVTRWRLNDLPIWPLLRTQLAARLLLHAREPAALPPIESTDEAAAYRSGRAERARLLRPVDVLFLGYASQRQLVEQTYYDRLFDPLAELLEARDLSSVHLEFRNEHDRYRAPQRRPSVRFRHEVDGILYAPPPLPIFSQDQERYDELLAQEPLATQRWEGAFAPMLWLADWFEDVLRQARPRLVFLSCWYSAVSAAMTLAAHRVGITTVEIQHGMQSAHFAYERFTAFPKGGYALLPSVLWTWTEADRDRIAAWPTDHHRALLGGNPWSAYCKDRGLSRDATDALRSIKGNGPNILISLNWSTGLSPELRGAMTSSPPDWTWWVRLHPAMQSAQGEVEAWCRQNVSASHAVGVPSQLPLPALLDAADVHLTLSSSVTQEATDAGVPSVTVDPRARRVYAAQIAQGWVRPADGDIIEALREQLAARAELSPRGATPDFSQTARALDQLLSENQR